MIKIDTRQKPSRLTNDDIAGYRGNTFWLLDGATQLVAPAHGMDASWHVGQLSHAFDEALEAEPDMDLPSLAKAAIQKVAAKFYEGTGLGAQSPQELRPFATLVLCRIAADKKSMEYLVVCDSTLAVIGPNGTKIITDTRIELTRPLAKTESLLREGYGFDSPEYKTEMRHVYDATAKRINQPDKTGFDVVGQDDTIIDRALTGTIDLNPPDHILLMSDGFTRAVDTLDIYPSWEDMLADLQANGTNSVMDKLRTAESSDPHGRQYLRSSIHDDATVLWIAPQV